jgi:hypothetical protein
MHNIQILRQNPEKVLDSLKQGKIEKMELAVDQVTDEFMLYGLRGGLIDELAGSFPDPRKECEITIKQILSASIAGHYQDMYAMSQSPYALHSPVLLGELGLNVKVLYPGEGISRRGTGDSTPFHGDVIRKMLDGMTPVELIDWYNRVVGSAYLRQAKYEPTIHILDCTELEVPLGNEKYEGSGVVSGKKGRKKGKKNDKEEKPRRGYKLGSLRSLLDDGGIITAIAFGAIQVHDLELCRNLLMTTPHLKPGDMLIEDMGFLDGKTISKLKKLRKVDITIPIRSDMQAYEDCLVTAYRPDIPADNPNRELYMVPWERHPTREKQQIKPVDHLDWMWSECSVPMNGVVVRELKEGKNGSGGRADYYHWVFGTTRLTMTGKQTIQMYELRPEIEEDHKQWKDGPWDMDEFTSTDLVQIVYHVICVLLAYNLRKIYANTLAGEAFAARTLRQLRRHQARNHEVSMLVYAGAYYAVFQAKFLIWILLGLPKEIQELLKPHFDAGFT